jgi:hypothetical protein
MRETGHWEHWFEINCTILGYEVLTEKASQSKAEVMKLILKNKAATQLFLSGLKESLSI